MCEQHFGCHLRILDYYHAAEHLHEVARAAAVATSDVPQSVREEQDKSRKIGIPNKRLKACGNWKYLLFVVTGTSNAK